MNKNQVPVPKVGAMGISGTLITLIIWVLSEYGGVEIPAEIAAIVITIITFVAGYVMPDNNARKWEQKFKNLEESLVANRKGIKGYTEQGQGKW